MKRAIAVLLSGVVFCTLVGCRRLPLRESDPSYIITEETVIPKTGNGETSASSKNAVSGKSSKQTTVTTKKTVRRSSTVSKTVPATEYNAYSYSEWEGAEIPQTFPTDTQITPASPTAVPQEAYYYYAGLSDTEKEVYQTVCTAAQNGDVVVDLSAFDCTSKTVYRIFQAIMADHPAFFHLAKNFSYTYRTKSNAVKNLILIYTDGSVTDEYRNDGTLLRMADRTKINRQIQAFDQAVSAVFAKIPDAADEAEKEKVLYDAVQNSVTYADEVTGYSPDTIRFFDAYGALCDGRAVCEGYAKLFQYLCYRAGINATQIYGTAGGESHMWNAVEIGGEWYMADVTWDDPDTEDLCCYEYFNLTSDELAADHTLNPDFSAPVCTATAYAFYRQFALFPESSFSPPSNVAAVLDRLLASQDRYLCVYTANIADRQKGYLSSQIFSPRCEVQRYLFRKKANFTLDSDYYVGEKYCYIPLRFH